MKAILILLSLFFIGSHAVENEENIHSILFRKLSGNKPKGDRQLHGERKRKRRVKKGTLSPTSSPTIEETTAPTTAPTTSAPTAAPTLSDMELAKSLLAEHYDMSFSEGEYPFWFYQINCEYLHDDIFGTDYEVEPSNPIEASFHGGSQACDIINWKLETAGRVVDTCRPVGGYMFDCIKKAFMEGGHMSYSMGTVDLGENLGAHGRNLHSSDDLHYELAIFGGSGILFNSGGIIGVYPLYGEEVGEVFILKVVGGPGLEDIANGHWDGLREYMEEAE